jgi:hypothetical protein
MKLTSSASSAAYLELAMPDLCFSLLDLLSPVPGEEVLVRDHLARCQRCSAARELGRYDDVADLLAVEAPEEIVPPFQPAAFGARLPVAVPTRVRTGDVWLVQGRDNGLETVAIFGALPILGESSFLAIPVTASTEAAGPGDFVVHENAGVSLGYGFMLSTWFAAVVPEHNFLRFFGRVRPAVRDAFLLSTRKMDRRRVQVGEGTIGGLRLRRGDRRWIFRARTGERLSTRFGRVPTVLARVPAESVHQEDAPLPENVLELIERAEMITERPPPPDEVAALLFGQHLRWTPRVRRPVERLLRPLARRNPDEFETTLAYAHERMYWELEAPALPAPEQAPAEPAREPRRVRQLLSDYSTVVQFSLERYRR